MAETSVLISGIEFKIRQLIEENEYLVIENKKLSDETLILQKKIEELALVNEQINEQINKKIIVNALGNETEEIEEGRKLIKALVKEIDQCIAILNKR